MAFHSERIIINKYNNSKIYKITCIESIDNDDLAYIGSTTKDL